MKENLPALFVPIALILLGILSPSNGVDDGYTKNVPELLIPALIIVLTVVIFFLLYNKVKSSRAARTDAEQEINPGANWTEEKVVIEE